MCKSGWNNIYLVPSGRADLVEKERQKRLGSKAQKGRIGYRSALGVWLVKNLGGQPWPGPCVCWEFRILNVVVLVLFRWAGEQQIQLAVGEDVSLIRHTIQVELPW